MQQHRLGTAVKNLRDVLCRELRLTLHDDIVTLDGNYLTRILVDEVFIPTLQHTGSKLAADGFLHVLLVHLHLFGQVEDLQDVLILLEADGTQQRCHGQLLLTVDVSIHDIVDISGKLNPRTLERDDAGRVKHSTISMHTLSEEHAGRTVKLRHDNSLGTVDDERTVARHIRNRAQENITRHRTKILVVGVSAVQFHLGLQGYAVSQAALQALVDRVTGRVDEVIQELKNEVITRVGDREVLGEHLIQTVILAFLRRSIQL